MTTFATPIIYPSEDGLPIAETFLHLYALFTTLEVLKQYLEGQQATVLANQFLYYAPGVPTARVTPDVMVIFGVAPGGRDNYKTWEEGQVPAVIFEMTSASTQRRDQDHKMTLYALLGVQECWLFDPQGEWIQDKLQGYRLETFLEDGELVNRYRLIEDGISQPLSLRLQVEGALLGFYRLDNGQKLLTPSELAAAVQQVRQVRQQSEQRATQAERQTEQARLAREQAEQRAEQAEQQAAQLAERLRSLGFDPDNL